MGKHPANLSRVTGGNMAKAHSCTDNFNDNARDTAKWAGFGQRRETNQRLEFQPTPNQTGTNFSGYSTQALWDLTHSSITIEVVQVLNQVPGTETLFSAGSDDANRVMLVASVGKLSCIQVVTGTSTTTAL